MIRYFEERETQIRRLEDEEFTDLLVCYSRALFEVGAFRKFLLAAEEVICLVIDRNIYTLRGEDVYAATLLRKAKAHYHLAEFGHSERVLRALLRMQPENTEAAEWLSRALMRGRRDWVGHTRGLAMLAFLLCGGVIFLELLLIRPFYLEWAVQVEALRIGLFAGGIGILAGGEGLHYLKYRRQVRRWVSESRKRR